MTLIVRFHAFAPIIMVCALLPTLLVEHADAQQQIQLEALSDQGTFMVEMVWTPNEIGRDNTFSISFIEPETGLKLEDMEYNIIVYGENSVIKLRRVDQTATQQRFSFEEPGPYTIRIDDIDGLGESANFPIQVTPEFPVGMLGLVVAMMVAVVIIVRRNSNNLFRF